MSENLNPTPHQDLRVYNRFSRKSPDIKYNERKTEILSSLRMVVREKLKQDPLFELTTATLDLIIKENKDFFPGLANASSVLYYFGGRIDNLKRPLGLPPSGPRRGDYE